MTETSLLLCGGVSLYIEYLHFFEKPIDIGVTPRYII